MTINTMPLRNFKTELATGKGQNHTGFHLSSGLTNMLKFPPEEFDSLALILTPTTYQVPVSQAKRTVKKRQSETMQVAASTH